MTTSSLEAARRVKDKVRDLAAHRDGFGAVGLTRIGDDYAVKVNLQSGSAQGLPEILDGVRVIYKVIGRVKARPAR